MGDFELGLIRTEFQAIGLNKEPMFKLRDLLPITIIGGELVPRVFAKQQDHSMFLLEGEPQPGLLALLFTMPFANSRKRDLRQFHQTNNPFQKF